MAPRKAKTTRAKGKRGPGRPRTIAANKPRAAKRSKAKNGRRKRKTNMD